MTQREIKRIALITMIIDHIGYFIPGMPMWMHYVGRISAPLFFFCCAWGFEHTRDKRKFMLRLYLAGVVMSLGNVAVYTFIGHNSVQDVPENCIFTTLFVGALICYMWEKKKYGMLFLFAVYQVSLFGLIRLLDTSIPHGISYEGFLVIVAVTGFLPYVEGGIMCVLLFVALYLFKDIPILLADVMLCYSYVAYKGANRAWNNEFLRFDVFNMWSFQYFAVFALIFMLLYNGQKGKGSKYFYYIFYPLHVWGLYIIQYFLG